MDFQKSTDINMDRPIPMVFGCQSSIIHNSEDIHTDIQAGISMQGHVATDIRKQ